MPWTQDVEDDLVAFYQNGVGTIFQKNPNGTIATLTGWAAGIINTGVVNAFENSLGPVDPPPPTTYGQANQPLYANIDAFTGSNGNEKPGQFFRLGEATDMTCTATTDPIQSGRQSYNCYFDDAIGAPGGPRRYTNLLWNPPGQLPTVSFSTADGSPLTLNGGYPPLNEEEMEYLGEVVTIFASAPLVGGGAGGQVAALSGQVAGIDARVRAIEPPVRNTEQLLIPIPQRITDLEEELAVQKLLLQDVLACTCGVVVSGCDGFPNTGMQNALNLIISEVCELQSHVGFRNGDVTLTDGSGAQLESVVDGLREVLRRIAFPVNRIYQTCNEDQEIGTVEGVLQLLVNLLNFGQGLVVGRDPETGATQVTCNVRDSLQALLDAPGENVFVQGFEVDSVPVRVLKISYGENGKKQRHARLQIPACPANLTAEQIRAAVGTKRSGEWLCQVTFEGGRKLLGWFESEIEGLEYLTLSASLSTLPLVVGSGAATHNAFDSPDKHLGVDLVPAWADLVEAKENGGETRRINLS